MVGSTSDRWTHGDSYEWFMGRWSRHLADSFVAWLGLPDGLRWLDAGCGTGEATAVVARSTTEAVTGLDPSPAYLRAARERVGHQRAGFVCGTATRLPFRSGVLDVVTSDLVINFLDDAEAAVAEMRRVVAPGGTVAACVWDYADGMQFLRLFWDAATALHPEAADLDEGRRFPVCRPDALGALWSGAGLRDVVVEPIEISTLFRDFDDLWEPFFGGQGPAPGFAVSLPEADRARLADELRSRLPEADDGSIPLRARAWAVRGQV